jgi:carbamoylphosphate synthase small subunit
VVFCSGICLVVILDVARVNAITDFGHRGANQPVERCTRKKAMMGTRCPVLCFDAASISQIPSTIRARLLPRC